MIYDFIISRGSIDVQNNLAFMRKTLESSEELPINIQTEFTLFQDCLSRFLQETKEDIEESAKTIMSKIASFTAPLDNEVTYRAISELICSLRFYNYDIFLIRRVDLVEDLPLDDGAAVVYLLDTKTSLISHIVDGKGRDFDDYTEKVNMTDAVMTWLITGDLNFQAEVEQLCYIDNIRNDYSNLKHRNMSIDYDASDVYNFLREIGQKVILVTNIVPGEYEIDYDNQLF